MATPDKISTRKIKLVVSDFHLGRGRRDPGGSLNPLEDFPYDHRFQEFLEYYTTGQYQGAEVELVFVGDMLNLIQVDYHGHFPVVLTESISAFKTRKIIEGHPVFFQALRDFLKNPRHSFTYVIGNHDQEMMWKECRRIFDEAIGYETNWKNFFYLVDGVHIEHGHQYEAVNRVDPQRPFLTEGLPEPILNLPWGTLFTAQYLVRLKMLRPFIDKVRPFRMVLWWCLAHDTVMAVSSLIKLVLYFISTRFTKNRTRYSSLRMTGRMLLEASVFPDLSNAARHILRSPEIHTVIFGHTHVYRHVQVGDSKQYLNIGTWTDIVSMELDSFARRSRLTYARIEYSEEDARPSCLLRHWIGRIPLEDDATG